MNIALIHCYSATNSGDALLVELALKRLRRLYPDAQLFVIALDASSFEYPDVLQWSAGSRWDSLLGNRGSQAIASTTRIISQDLRKALIDCDLIVGVGGGYLRGGDSKEFLKTFLAHFGQIRRAAKSGVPAVYLPQSVGPFSERSWRFLRRFLSEIDIICLRDDRSFRLFDGLQNCLRLPDLAVLELAERAIVPQAPQVLGRPVIVARSLSNAGLYYDTLSELAGRRRFDFAVQAFGRGNNDVTLTESISGAPVRLLRDVLSEGPRVVVSTRLHGSLGALIEGSPTVHLGYERKSWGAFEDLGVPQFVQNARRVSAQAIVDLVDSIESDTFAYWSTLSRAHERILKSSESLDSAILGTTGTLER